MLRNGTSPAGSRSTLQRSWGTKREGAAA